MSLFEALQHAIDESVAAHKQWALAVVEMNARFGEGTIEEHETRLARAWEAHEAMVRADQQLVTKSMERGLARARGDSGT